MKLPVKRGSPRRLLHLPLSPHPKWLSQLNGPNLCVVVPRLRLRLRLWMAPCVMKHAVPLRLKPQHCVTCLIVHAKSLKRQNLKLLRSLALCISPQGLPRVPKKKAPRMRLAKKLLNPVRFLQPGLMMLPVKNQLKSVMLLLHRVVMAGVLMMSFERTLRSGAPLAANDNGGNPLWAILTDKATGVAFGCAVSFAISFLTFREAALVIGEGTFLWRGGWTVVLAILMQTVVIGVWLAWREPDLVTKLKPHVRKSVFIGATSAVGSICWFTAFALENASYVRAVGQIEVVFTLLVSALYYRERISFSEYAGIGLTMLGVLMFRLMA